MLQLCLGEHCKGQSSQQQQTDLRSIREISEEGEKGCKEQGEFEAPLISASVSQVVFYSEIIACSLF